MREKMFINKRSFIDVKGSKGLQEIMYEGGMASGVIDFRFARSPYIHQSIKDRLAVFVEQLEPDVLQLKLLQTRDIYFMQLNQANVYNVQAKQYILPNDYEEFDDDMIKEV